MTSVAKKCESGVKSVIVTCVLLENLWNGFMKAVYANYIGPSVMTEANCEVFPICDDRILQLKMTDVS